DLADVGSDGVVGDGRRVDAGAEDADAGARVAADEVRADRVLVGREEGEGGVQLDAVAEVLHRGDAVRCQSDDVARDDDVGGVDQADSRVGAGDAVATDDVAVDRHVGRAVVDNHALGGVADGPGAGGVDAEPVALDHVAAAGGAATAEDDAG